ncbi:MAG: hypothetical protein R3B09_20500 [Nannocystaceae bacterium]
MAASRRAPASLRFTAPTDEVVRSRVQRGLDPAHARHHAAATAWLEQQLRGPVDASAVRAARGASSPADVRARWPELRAGLGALTDVIVSESRNVGPLAAAAGSYEPEIHGREPDRVHVTLTATGRTGHAEVELEVRFASDSATLPEVSLRSFRPRASPPKQAPPNDDERLLMRLSEAICDAPDDDEPRERLAAYWIARGEPRGEFVRAQLAGDDRRAEALLKRHGADWTDGLPVDREGRVYRRGFLCEARVACPPAMVKAAIDNPAWSLLVELALSIRHCQDIEREFLKHAPLTGLKRLTGVSAATVEALPLPPGIAHLQVVGRIHACPEGLLVLEIVAHRFEDLWVFARQDEHPQLAALAVTASGALEGGDILALQGLLAAPRPARVVLIGLAYDDEPSGEAWRLEVVGDVWEFRGDDDILRRIRDVDPAPSL